MWITVADVQDYEAAAFVLGAVGVDRGVWGGRPMLIGGLLV